MSLINQVLKDLEQRRAASEAARLPRDVRPLPAPESSRGAWLAAGLALSVAAGAGLWAWQTLGPGRPLPVAPELAVRAVADTAMPPLAVALPDPAPLPIPAQSTGELVADVPAAAPRADGAPSLRLSPELRTIAAGQAPAANPAPAALAARAAPPVGARAETPPVQAPAVPPVTAPVSSATALVPEEAPGAIEKQPVAATPQEKAERLYRSALGQINLGRTDDGVTTLRAALREDPAHVAARQTLVRMYVDSRALDAAAGVLRDGLEKRPEQVGWAMLLSRILVERGDPAGALAVLERHETGARDHAAYQGGMGAVLQRLERQEAAAARYESATRAEPANGRWWLGLATAQEARGHSAEARAAYQRALATRSLPADLQAFAEAKLK